MPLIKWDDSYSVSVKTLDEQHKKLFVLINQLHDAMSAGKGKEIIESVLKDMIDYTHTHFTTEEKLLEKHHYPYLEQQKQEHALFIQKVSEMQQKYKTGSSLTISFEVSQFLKNWLSNHIKLDDKKYSTFLVEKGEK